MKLKSAITETNSDNCRKPLQAIFFFSMKNVKAQCFLWLLKVFSRSCANVTTKLTITEHLIVRGLTHCCIQNSKLEIDSTFLFLKSQEILSQTKTHTQYRTAREMFEPNFALPWLRGSDILWHAQQKKQLRLLHPLISTVQASGSGFSYTMLQYACSQNHCNHCQWFCQWFSTGHTNSKPRMNSAGMLVAGSIA